MVPLLSPLSYEPSVVSPELPLEHHRSPSSPDINRLHPIHSNPHGQLANVQASATGHILENADVASGIKARVLIVNNTPERGSGGYVGLMNSVFAAQKRVRHGLERVLGMDADVV